MTLPTWTLRIEKKDDITSNLNRIADLKFNTETPVTCLGGKVTLVSLNIQKEMYVPGHIEAVLEIKPMDNGGRGKLNCEALLNSFVTIYDKIGDTVAINYVIFDYSLEDTRATIWDSCYVTLGIYSPEHCLTFKKEKKCYVAKKLGADIFTNIAKGKNQIKNYDCSSLLRINETKADGGKIEFIQPYLVQYEETALDFLTRVANECGEFLYYEDGKWVLGGISYIHRDLRNYSRLNYKKITSNEEDGDDDVVVGTKEEYLETLSETEFKNFFEDWQKRFSPFSWPGAIFNISKWLKKPTLMDSFVTYGVDIAFAAIKAAAKRDDQVKLWNEAYISPWEKNTEQYGEVNGKKVVCQFSNYNAKSRYGQKFYKEIRTGEKKASKNKIHINFGTNYQTLLLGDKIVYNNTGYYISKISFTCRYKDSKEEYTSYEIDAIPAINSVIYPPLLERKATTKVENQVVTVTANNDPLNLGRVQIRYPWQNSSDNPSSPWVSIAQPFASDKAGMRFMPQVGDNIIVGYEHGRMERPFMVGGVSTSKRNLDLGVNISSSIENAVTNSFIDNSKNGFIKNDFIIKSPNGQYIKFIAPSNSSYMNLATTTFLPCVTNWLGYMPQSWDTVTYAGSDIGKEFSGGISIGDAYGLFNINMSTEKRKVLISSAFGDVQIDAFTGITISAPNGNVKIEGKNVEIVAGNNLTLKSGTNVDKKKVAWTGADFRGSLYNNAMSQVKKMAKLVDLTLIRTLLEAIVKPVGGTMLIKSRTYLRLEAGTGTTALPKDAYKTEKHQGIVRKKQLDMETYDTISATKKVTDAYEECFRSHIIRFKHTFTGYIFAIDRFKKGLAQFLGARGIIKWDEGVVQNLDSFNDQVDNVKAIVSRYFEKKNPDAVHPKLDKFELAQGNADINNLNNTKKLLEYTQNRASQLATVVDSYYKKMEKIVKNGNGIIQDQYIGMKDESICPTINKTQYKNTIFHYMSTDGNVELNPGAYDFDGQNLEPTGLLQFIWNSLPKEMKECNFADTPEDFTISREIRRKIFHKAINTLTDFKLLSINDVDLLNGLGVLAHNVDGLCADDEAWQKYLEYVTPYKKEDGLGMTILKATDYFGAKDIIDVKDNWNDEAAIHDIYHEGKILLADSSGNSCNMEKDGLKITTTSYLQNAKREFLKDC